ncbi:MAG: AGE family epimerase/isomerase, partial [Bacteroidota bacterium]
RMPDQDAGGFFGLIDGYNQLHEQADKALILHTRLLWTFSEASRLHFQETYLAMADRAYAFLMQFFWDHGEGGFYWTLSRWGEVIEPKKQIYGQAFAIYALAAYYRVSGKKEALERAFEVYWLIEKYSQDKKDGGYWEAFTRDWGPMADMRLSEKDANSAKTMNTHLHILEAYATLYEVSGEQYVADSLQALVETFLNRIIGSDKSHMRLFFDPKWKVEVADISYGHDIEAAWLLGEAVALLPDPSLRKKVEEWAVLIARKTYQEGQDVDGGLVDHANASGWTKTHKDWWPQVEAMVGFHYAYELSQDEAFLHAMLRAWNFIKEKIKDPLSGEWLWGIDERGLPDRSKEIAGPWKTPYHNGRALMELLRRGRS